MKTSLFILSMVPLMCIVALMCGYMPICFEEGATFVGFDVLWRNNLFPIIGIAVAIIIGLGASRFLKWRFESKAPNLSETVVSFENRNYDTMNFVASYFVPLVSFQFCDDLKFWLILCFIVFILCKISLNSNMYYNNPVLIILNFRIYEVKVKKQAADKVVSKIIITKDEISKDVMIKCVNLSDNIYYAKLWKNKN